MIRQWFLQATTMDRLLHLTRWLSLAVAVILFGVHVSNNIALWSREPLDSSYTIHNDVPLYLPSVTVCPNPPFDKLLLLEHGLNFSLDAVKNSRKYVNEDEQDFPGGVNALWQSGAWSIGKVVAGIEVAGHKYTYSNDQTRAPGWNHSFTPLGPCLTFTPQNVNAVDRSTSIVIKLKAEPLQPCITDILSEWTPDDCQFEPFPCNTSCAWQDYIYYINSRKSYLGANLILHSPDDPPTLADIEAVILIREDTITDGDIDIWVSSRQTNLIGSTSSPCIPTPDYSEVTCRQLCGLPCHPRIQTNAPEHPTWRPQSLNTSCPKPPKEDMVEYQNLTKGYYDCVSQCKPRCRGTLFKYETHQRFGKVDHSVTFITIRQKTNFLTTVSEHKVYPTSKLLSDLGGSVGLFLGWSFLSLWSAFGQVIESALAKIINMHQKIYCTIRKSKIHSSTNDSVKQTTASSSKPRKGGTSKHSMDSHVFRRHSQILYWWIGVTTCGCFTSVLLLLSTISYTHQPVTTLLSVNRDAQLFPEVIVCPDMPFKPTVLKEYGITASESYNSDSPRKLFMHHIINELHGFWNKEPNLTKFWKDGEKDLNDIISSCMHSSAAFECQWKPVLTTNNVCYQLQASSFPEVTNAVSVDLYINMEDLGDECKLIKSYRCPAFNTKTVWITVPEAGHIPLIIFQEESFPRVTVLNQQVGVVLTFAPITVQRVQPCLPNPYSRKQCVHQCIVESKISTTGCSLPYDNVSNAPLCRSQEQYRGSLKYIIAADELSNTGSLRIDECEASCPKECFTKYYYLEKTEPMDYPNLKVTFSVNKDFLIKEHYAKSVIGLLCEIGGNIGLGLGWCLLDIANTFAIHMTHINRHLHASTVQHLKTIISFLYQLLCSAIACLLWVERIYAYFWNHPYYTSFSILPIQAQNFPSVTVCRWPPFNLSRLLEMGLEYDSALHCNYNGRYYRCSKGSDTLRDLRGVWQNPLDEVWQASTWELHDLVNGYYLDAKYIPITQEKETHGGWQAVLTEYNRCFTFTPEGKDRLTSYSVVLNTDYTGERRPRVNDTVKLLLNSLHLENPAHSVLRVHAAEEKVYKVSKDLNMEKVKYGLHQSVYYSVSLTEVHAISREGKLCDSSPEYSEASCLSKCLELQIAKEAKCRLPYLKDAEDIALCNASSEYVKYPRQHGKITVHNPSFLGGGEKGINTSVCQESCLAQCHRRIYGIKTHKTSADENKVVVSFGQGTRDVVVEEDGYHPFQLLSDLGGVAGFVLGISLLSILNSLINLVQKLTGYNRISPTDTM